MRRIEERFRLAFAPWGIALRPEHVSERKRGKIVASGWAIWYLFGEDERGEYLDYYASDRMTDDRHVRVREDGSQEPLPVINTFRVVSGDKRENARLEAEWPQEMRSR